MDTFDNIAQQYYGKNYDKAMRLTKDTREKMRRDVLKRYPDTDIDKFTFEVSVDQELNVEKNIYYKIDNTTSYDITPDTFLNNTEWTNYLMINKKVRFGYILHSKTHIVSLNTYSIGRHIYTQLYSYIHNYTTLYITIQYYT